MIPAGHGYGYILDIVLGNGMHSRKCWLPQIHANVRSSPMP